MKRFASCVLCAVGWLLLGAADVQAQPVVGGVGAPSRPPVSPYINMLRQGGTPTLNYFGLVRPEQQFQQAIGNLQGAVGANQQAIGNLQTDVNGLPVTGHPTQFMNYGGYFMNGGAGSGIGSGGANRFQFQGRTPQPGSGLTGTGGAGSRRR